MSSFSFSNFEQIHGTTLLRTLVPQTSKFSLGVETIDEVVGETGKLGTTCRLPRTFIHTFFMVVF